jgi:hypothetical protein
VALARAIYAVPALVLIVGAHASGSPTVILVLFAMAFCVVATETVLDRRIEALLTVLQLKGQVPPDERLPRTSP